MPYKNAEKRKEKSRDAARTRRSKEADVFAELSGLIPFPTATVAALDKTSLMRLCISYLKLRTLGNGLKNCINTKYDAKYQEQYLKSINGFLVVLDKNGDMVYVSDNIEKHIGLAQIDLVGQNIFEYSHPCDHDEIREVLEQKQHSSDETNNNRETTFFARLKCTLTNKGRNVNLKSATFKVIGFRGHRLHDVSPDTWVLVGESIPHPSHTDVVLDSFSFLTRHDMDMKFSYCDEKVCDLLGYSPEDLLDQPLFEFHHALDGEHMDKTYKHLFSKGQVWTDQYRFLACGGGYAWVETQATVVYNSKTEKPQYIICIHFMISGIESPEVVMSAVQLPSSSSMSRNNKILTANNSNNAYTTCQAKKRSSDLDTTMLSTQPVFPSRSKLLQNNDVCINKCSDVMNLNLVDSMPNEIIPLNVNAQENNMAALLEEIFVDSDIELDDDKNTSISNINQADKENKISAPDLESFFESACEDMKPVLPVEQPFIQPIPEPTKQDSYTFDGEHIDIVVTDVDNMYPCPKQRVPFVMMANEECMEKRLRQALSFFNEDQFFPLSPATYELIYGTTESIFNVNEEQEDNQRKNNIPLSLLRQEAMQKQEQRYQGEMGYIKIHIKQKPALETNRLETGPPACKKSRLISAAYRDEEPVQTGGIDYAFPSSLFSQNNDSIQGSSVLKNLLVSGYDKEHNYKLVHNHQEKNAMPSLTPAQECFKNNLQESSSTSRLRDLLTGPDPLQPALPLSATISSADKTYNCIDQLQEMDSTDIKPFTSPFQAPDSNLNDHILYCEDDLSLYGDKSNSHITQGMTLNTVDAYGNPTGQKIILNEKVLKFIAGYVTRN